MDCKSTFHDLGYHYNIKVTNEFITAIALTPTICGLKIYCALLKQMAYKYEAIT